MLQRPGFFISDFYIFLALNKDKGSDFANCNGLKRLSVPGTVDLYVFGTDF